MGISIQVHPDEYEAKLFPDEGHGAFAVVKAHEDRGTVTLFLPSTAACDELIKAAVLAKRLLGEQHDHDDAGLPWTSGAHQFIPCTGCTADACNACSRPAGDAVHRIAGDFGPQQVNQ